MGTRSMTRFLDADMKPFVAVYQQWDGYLSGVGADIKKCLGGKTLVNGYNDASKQINGIESAAAMFIAFVASPTSTGGVYLYNPAENNEQEYNYDIYVTGADTENTKWDRNPGRLAIKVWREYEPNKIIYEGLLDNFDPDMEKDNDEE